MGKFKHIEFSPVVLKENGMNWLKKPGYSRDETYITTNQARFILPNCTFAYVLSDSDIQSSINEVAGYIEFVTVKDRGAVAAEYFNCSIVYNVNTLQFYIKETAYSATPSRVTYDIDEIILMDNYLVELAAEAIVQPPLNDSDLFHKSVDNEFLTLPQKTALTGNELVLAEDPANNNRKTKIPTSSIVPDLSGYVTKALYDANTMLLATSDNTPFAATQLQILTFLGVSNSNQVTVGPTIGQYATIQLALAASKFNMMIVENLAITDHIVLSQATKITGIHKDITLTFAAEKQFQGDYSLTLQDCKVIFAFSSTLKLLPQTGLDFKLKCFNVYFDNNSTIAGAKISESGAFYFCTLDLPNFSGNGIIFISLDSIDIQNCQLIGGGSGCSNCIKTNIDGANVQSLPVRNIITSGTFSASVPSIYASIDGANITVTTVLSPAHVYGYIRGVCGWTQAKIILSGNISNVRIEDCFVYSIDLAIETNCYIRGCEINTEIKNLGTYNVIEKTGFTTITAIKNHCKLLDCVAYNLVTITTGVQWVEFSGGRTISGITINSGATFNMIHGGYHDTITINGNNNNVTNVLQSISIT
jgi:hypothetical protein